MTAQIRRFAHIYLTLPDPWTFRMTLRHHIVASLYALSLAASLAAVTMPASAQDYGRPPPGFGDDRDDGGPPSDASDAAGLTLRVGKLEGRIREMTGQIEELQNANRKLVDQLQRFQADVDSRLTSGAGRLKRGDAGTSGTTAVGDAGVAAGVDAAPPARKRRDDAFDPDAAPSAPGKPKPLGSLAAATPDEASDAPMDLSGGKLRRAEGSGGGDALAPTLQLPSSTPRAAVGPATPGGAVIANAGPANTPREEYETALGYFRDKQYDTAEKGFTAFIEKNPKNRLVADATYFLGESFAQRGRSREAAEQYLKISTDYANSTRAPDAMLHLGLSLKALGAKEQACATFGEVSRKYPNAPAYVRSGAEREAKRAQC